MIVTIRKEQKVCLWSDSNGLSKVVERDALPQSYYPRHYNTSRTQSLPHYPTTLEGSGEVQVVIPNHYPKGSGVGSGHPPLFVSDRTTLSSQAALEAIGRLMRCQSV